MSFPKTQNNNNKMNINHSTSLVFQLETIDRTMNAIKLVLSFINFVRDNKFDFQSVIIAAMEKKRHQKFRHIMILFLFDQVNAFVVAVAIVFRSLKWNSFRKLIIHTLAASTWNSNSRDNK